MGKVKPGSLIAVIVAIAAGSVALGGGRFFLGNDTPTAEPDPCDIPKTVQGTVADATPIVHIVEQGQTLGRQTSVGAILENKGTNVAYQTQVTFTLSGAPPKTREVDIPVI